MTLTKPNFEVIWSFKNPSLFFMDILELKNGNFLVTGFLNNAVQLHLISPAGTILWSNKYSVDMPNGTLGGYDEDNQLHELSDGNVIWVLNAGSDVYKGIGTKPKILKLNPNDGSIIWQKEFNSLTANYEYASDMFEDSDNHLWISYLSGTVYSNDAHSGVLKLDKDGNKIWFKKFTTKGVVFLKKKSDVAFEGILSTPTVATKPNNQTNIYFTLDKSGNVSGKFKENYPFTISKAWTTNSNLVLIGKTPNCKNPALDNELIVQQRSIEEKSPCAEPASLTLNDSTLVLSLIYKEVKVQSISKPTTTTAPATIDYAIKTINDTQYCQDTTFVKRCSGDNYVIGKNKYPKEGTYRDTLTTTTCDSVVLTTLTFEKVKPIQLDTTICEGKTITFWGKNYNKAGIYSDTLISALGCDSIISINLKTKTFDITTSNETTVKIAEATPLSAQASLPNVTWQWLPTSFLSCSDCADPIVKPLESTLYSIVATNKEGCRAETKLRINVKGGEEVFVPTIFSPNGDGLNDRFMIFTNTSIPTIKQFAVYDRWGNLVFENNNFPPNDASYGWDGNYRGQKSQTGVYVYRITIEKADGTTQILKGDVFLP